MSSGVRIHGVHGRDGGHGRHPFGVGALARLASGAAGRRLRLGGPPRPRPQGGFAHRDALAIHAEDQHAAGALHLLGRGAALGVVQDVKVLCRLLHELLGLALGHVCPSRRRERGDDVVKGLLGGLDRHAVPHTV